MRQLKFLILGLLFVVAGFLLGLGVAQEADRSNQAASQQAPQRATSVMIDTGDELLGFGELAVGEGETVWSLLERLDRENEELSITATDYRELGILIESINGYENGADKNYWQYWVNNQYAQVAANSYQLSAGDVILWKFTSSRYEAYE